MLLSVRRSVKGPKSVSMPSSAGAYADTISQRGSSPIIFSRHRRNNKCARGVGIQSVRLVQTTMIEEVGAFWQGSVPFLMMKHVHIVRTKFLERGSLILGQAAFPAGDLDDNGVEELWRPDIVQLGECLEFCAQLLRRWPSLVDSKQSAWLRCLAVTEEWQAILGGK